MSNNISNNKRLAKNTIFLYGRTIIVMFVSLYVSRLILSVLGVSDYGVYNAVGGMVGMFALISGSLVAATQRYITFELGKEDGNPSYVFSLAMGLHLLISIIIFVFAETVGIWFLNIFMNLPSNRMVAANWVFQFSLCAFVINLLMIPYDAVIIAQERMDVFAVISVVEVLLKLGFALILLVAFTEKLIYYAASMMLVSFAVLLFNLFYCRKRYADNCRFQLITSFVAYKQIGGFVGWNFIGSSATVLSKQGINVLLNIFCGVIVNAGRGIATQVDNAVNQFINSFSTAVRPQITKTYAAQEFEECFNLVNQSTKLIVFLTMLFVTPLLFRTDYVLTLWLKIVPDYAVLFTQLSFLIIVMDALSTPLYYLMLATGIIRNYQLVVGSLSLLVLPLTWIGLIFGLKPEIAYYILFVINIIRWIFQLIFLQKTAHFAIKNYLCNSIVPISVVAMITIFFSYCINKMIPNNFYGFVFFALSTTIIISLTVLYGGLNKREKVAFWGIVKDRFVKK